jgi:hypothetical protein
MYDDKVEFSNTFPIFKISVSRNCKIRPEANTYSDLDSKNIAAVKKKNHKYKPFFYIKFILKYLA